MVKLALRPLSRNSLLASIPPDPLFALTTFERQPLFCSQFSKIALSRDGLVQLMEVIEYAEDQYAVIRRIGCPGAKDWNGQIKFLRYMNKRIEESFVPPAFNPSINRDETTLGIKDVCQCFL